MVDRLDTLLLAKIGDSISQVALLDVPLQRAHFHFKYFSNDCLRFLAPLFALIRLERAYYVVLRVLEAQGDKVLGVAEHLVRVLQLSMLLYTDVVLRFADVRVAIFETLLQMPLEPQLPDYRLIEQPARVRYALEDRGDLGLLLALQRLLFLRQLILLR